MRKRILMISYEEFNLHIGLNTRVKGLIKAMCEKGMSVELAVPCYSEENASVREYYGAKIHHVMMKNVFDPILIPIITRVFFVHYFNKSVLRYFKGKVLEFDLIQSEQMYPFSAGFKLAKQLSAKVVLDDPTMLCYLVDDKLNKITLLNNLVKWFVSKYEYSVYKKADYVFCSSQKTADYMKSMFAISDVKVRYAPNGLDVSNFSLDEKKQFTNKIFFNSSLPYYQNMAALKNLYKILLDCRSKAILNFTITVIINKQSFMPLNIKQNLEDMSQVELLSAVDSLVPYIDKADIVLLPYEKGHTLTAGSRLKAVEALGAGKLVLSTLEGVDGVIGVEDNINFMLCDDWKDMTEKLQNVLSGSLSDEKIKNIQRNARRLVEEKYSWNKIVDVYSSV